MLDIDLAVFRRLGVMEELLRSDPEAAAAVMAWAIVSSDPNVKFKSGLLSSVSARDLEHARSLSLGGKGVEIKYDSDKQKAVEDLDEFIKKITGQ